MNTFSSLSLAVSLTSSIVAASDNFRVLDYDRSAEIYFNGVSSTGGFGSSSMATCGDYFVIGAPYDSVVGGSGSTIENSGSIFIYSIEREPIHGHVEISYNDVDDDGVDDESEPSYWFINKITSSEMESNTQFGQSLSMACLYDEDSESDLLRIAVGGSENAWIFDYNVDDDEMVESSYFHLTPPPNDDSDEHNFGYSIDISSHGNKLIIGEYTLYDGQAHVYEYDNEDNDWFLISSISHFHDSIDYDGKGYYFGESVTINNNYAIIGCGNCGQGRKGAVYIYAESSHSDEYEQIETFTSGKEQNWEYFGKSVSVSDSSDGDDSDSNDDFTDVLVIGAPGYDYSDSVKNVGAVYIFSVSNSIWVEDENNHLSSSDMTGSEQFGISVDISNNGNNIIIGAIGVETVLSMPDEISTDTKGAAYVFNKDEENDEWNQAFTLINTNLDSSAMVGKCVTISNNFDFAIVGNTGVDGNGVMEEVNLFSSQE